MLELALIIDLILGRWVEATVIAALLLFSHSGPLHPAWKYVPVRPVTPCSSFRRSRRRCPCGARGGMTAIGPADGSRHGPRPGGGCGARSARTSRRPGSGLKSSLARTRGAGPVSWGPRWFGRRTGNLLSQGAAPRNSPCRSRDDRPLAIRGTGIARANRIRVLPGSTGRPGLTLVLRYMECRVPLRRHGRYGHASTR